MPTCLQAGMAKAVVTTTQIPELLSENISSACGSRELVTIVGTDILLSGQISEYPASPRGKAFLRYQATPSGTYATVTILPCQLFLRRNRVAGRQGEVMILTGDVYWVHVSHDIVYS